MRVVLERLSLVAVCVILGGAGGCRRAGDPLVLGSLPGALPRRASLEKKLHDALAARGPSYTPHTRNRDGNVPRYSNRLLLETSPYLVQHAHNPVDWYPWGEEAFAAARASSRPILLSIGYATCHWCHVMEDESFEDPAVAETLNSRYICIKVDREERPDIDATYLHAVEKLTGSGGWPMTLWLTPAREPFFGGTYFPAHDGPRGVGLTSLATSLAERYRADPGGVARDAQAITRSVREELSDGNSDARAGAGTGTGAGIERPVSSRALADAAAQATARFDSVNGGARGAPKFPSSFPVRVLLRHHRRTGDLASLAMARRTLDKMAAGGIYDQLGGGFHRYSVDERWAVPHFEKMLYDNALLALAYLEAHQVTGETDYARVAAETLDAMLRDLRSDDGGGFVSASDADSEGVEGKFYVWSKDEIDRALGDGARRFDRYYGVTAAGALDGNNVLAAIAPDATERALLSAARATLLAVRARRVPPSRDDKILAAWNGLAISALATGGRVLSQPAYLSAARRAARYVLVAMRPGGQLQRSYRAGVAHEEAFLEDYSFLVAGLLDLYQATFEPEWLRDALVLAAVMDDRFADRVHGGWFLTPETREPLLGRIKPSFDGAEPSGASLALDDLLRLAALTDDPRWQRSADRALAAYGDDLAARPLAHAQMLLSLDRATDAPREIVIVWPKSRFGLAAFEGVLATTFIPTAVIAGAEEGTPLAALAKEIPLLDGKRAIDGKATAYVCERRVCQLPTTDSSTFARQLLKATPLD